MILVDLYHNDMDLTCPSHARDNSPRPNANITMYSIQVEYLAPMMPVYPQCLTGPANVRARAEANTDPTELALYGGGQWPHFSAYQRGELAANGNYYEADAIAVRHGICGDPVQVIDHPSHGGAASRIGISDGSKVLRIFLPCRCRMRINVPARLLVLVLRRRFSALRSKHFLLFS